MRYIVVATDANKQFLRPPKDPHPFSSLALSGQTWRAAYDCPYHGQASSPYRRAAGVLPMKCMQHIRQACIFWAARPYNSQHRSAHILPFMAASPHGATSKTSSAFTPPLFHPLFAGGFCLTDQDISCGIMPSTLDSCRHIRMPSTGELPPLPARLRSSAEHHVRLRLRSRMLQRFGRTHAFGVRAPFFADQK